MQHIFQHKIQELVYKNSKSNQSHKNGKEKKRQSVLLCRSLFSFDNQNAK
jgi:hypothetical protein